MKQDQLLEAELETLRKEKGDFNEDIVLKLAMANPNAPLADSVDAYFAEVTRIREESRKPAPKVLGQGGGTVDSQITKDQMKNPQDRKAVIAQMLAAGRQT